MLENEPPRDRETEEIEPKVLSNPGHTLDQYWQNKTRRHVVNFQIACEISQSSAPSGKYHSFFFFKRKFYLAMFSDVRFQFI